MAERWQFWSAVTVRLGIAAGGVLGGFAGYWIVAFSTPGEEGLLAWPTAAGAVAGLAASWVVLAWLAARHKGAGVVAGATLIAAAAVALLLWAARSG